MSIPPVYSMEPSQISLIFLEKMQKFEKNQELKINLSTQELNTFISLCSRLIKNNNTLIEYSLSLIWHEKKAIANVLLEEHLIINQLGNNTPNISPFSLLGFMINATQREYLLLKQLKKERKIPKIIHQEHLVLLEEFTLLFAKK